MKRPCSICSGPVETSSPGVYREVTGWEKFRGHTGGANQIAARRETGRVACPSCVTSLKSGIDRSQEEMPL